jgi:SAM-dependent methyltransferase
MSIHFHCPSCGSPRMTLFYKAENVPVHSCIMLDTEREALDFPMGDIRLGLCEQCGFISNTAFDHNVQEYTAAYEDQQSFSPTFNTFAKRLARQLIDKYGLRDKTVVEIGCGKGDFLALLCEMGNNRGVGIDPTCIKERIESVALDRITVVPDYYSERYAHHRGDLIVCRHTLEHIHATKTFIETIRNAIGSQLGTNVFFEIPDASTTLKDHAFWDIYYEHCSYFSPGSLARLFRTCGFEVIDLYREYDDQYLLIEARSVAVPSSTTHRLEESVEQMIRDVEHFASGVRAKIERWRDRICELGHGGKPPAIWGSGSKCVALLTTLGLRDDIGCVVDINPYRQGKFIPGLGKQVVSPAYLEDYRPKSVIVMNPIYLDEVTDMVRNMQLDAEVTSL